MLLPATMKLLGDWNWYLPKRLRWLPDLGHNEGPRFEPRRGARPRLTRRRQTASTSPPAGVWSAAMYVSVSRLRVQEDRVDGLVAAFRARAGLVDELDGFVDLQVWRSDRDPGEVLMVSRWSDRERFKTYMKSQEHRVSHGRIDGGLQDAIRLERLEHLHTYEVVAE